ncbi:MAG: hypothetical protein ACI32H_05675 [Bacilli bacterium]
MKDSKKVTKKSPAVKVEEKFIEEENDNRVIIFIAIAILVIIGTIIGLLVGCDKKSEEKDPVKPKDDIVVPDKKEEDKKEDKKTTVIKKVTTKANDTKEETYVVSFNLLDEDDVYTVEVKNGKVSPYVPSGYNSCKYYADENLTKEFDFTNKITGNTNIYTSCNIAVYTIIYDKDTNSQTEYNLKEGKVALSDANLETGFFEGWYTTPDFSGERVNYLSRDLIKIANEQNEIHLYAKVVENYKIRYYSKNGQLHATFTFTSKDEMPVTIENYGGQAPEGMKRLGFTTNPESNVIEYKIGQKVTLTGDLDLYSVFGTARVIYESEGETVTVGMTTEELDNYNLPTPDEVGLKTPTYFVKVDKTKENAKEVVPDEIEELLDNQIKISDAKSKAGENETIEVGDSVEELEKVFDGWQAKETDEEGNEILVDVDDTYKPEDNTDNELVAKWKEQDKATDTADTTEENEEENTTETLDIVEEEVAVEETVPEVSTNVEVTPQVIPETTM